MRTYRDVCRIQMINGIFPISRDDEVFLVAFIDAAMEQAAKDSPLDGPYHVFEVWGITAHIRTNLVPADLLLDGTEESGLHRGVAFWLNQTYVTPESGWNRVYVKLVPDQTTADSICLKLSFEIKGLK